MLRMKKEKKKIEKKKKKFAKCKWKDDFLPSVSKCPEQHGSLIVRRELKVRRCLCIFLHREFVMKTFESYSSLINNAAIT